MKRLLQVALRCPRLQWRPRTQSSAAQEQSNVASTALLNGTAIGCTDTGTLQPLKGVKIDWIKGPRDCMPFVPRTKLKADYGGGERFLN